jgi:hypothetical protein
MAFFDASTTIRTMPRARLPVPKNDPQGSMKAEDASAENDPKAIRNTAQRRDRYLSALPLAAV